MSNKRLDAETFISGLSALFTQNPLAYANLISHVTTGQSLGANLPGQAGATVRAGENYVKEVVSDVLSNEEGSNQSEDDDTSPFDGSGFGFFRAHGVGSEAQRRAEAQLAQRDVKFSRGGPVMYSGIGSFAKRFQTGGEAETTTNGSGSGLDTIGDDSGSSSTTGAPLSYEQFIAAFPSGPGGLINGMTKEQAYQAYLAAHASGFTGGNFNFTGVNTGPSNQNTLPSYLSINPETGLAVIPVGTTNRQFVEAMKILDLIPDEDYKWLMEYFTGENGEQTWLAARYNQPDTNINRDNFFGGNNLNEKNTGIMNRLFDVFDAGSQAGGFTPAEGFYEAGYSIGFEDVRGDAGGSTASTGAGATAPAPVFYTLDDILVSSSEQPNLYDRFNPYPVGDFKYYREQNNPYQSVPTIGYGYQAPPTITTNPNNLVFETEQAEAVDPVVDEAEVVDTTEGTGGTGVTVDEDVITGDTATGTTDTTGTTGTTDTSTNNTTPTGTFNNLLGSTTEQTTIPIKDAEGYIRTALFKDIDPYIYGKRGILGGQKVREGSKRNLSTQEFMDVLAGQSGTGSYGGDLIYDPDRGIIYSGVSDRMDEARQQAFMDAVGRAQSRGAVPFLVDPSLLTDVEKIRTRHLYGGEGGTTSTRIGDTQYFVNDDGTITALDVKDIQYGYTPGFAEGGIVDVYDDGMVSMQTTGEGIESFLNPERSKATLRRNLAKLAPRPTAPVMQQGIMPMAR